MDEFENAFDESFDTPVEEGVEETPVQVEEPEVTEEPYTYKVLGESKSLSRGAVDALASELGYQGADLITALQKGADYDRKAEEARRYVENQDAIRAIETFAQIRGVPTKEAADAILQLNEKVLLAQEVNAVREEDPTLTPEQARKYAELRLKNRQIDFQKQAEERAKAEEEEMQKPMVDFFLNHREMLNAELPPRFVELVGNGMSPEEAYAVFQMEQMREELETLRSAKESKKSNPGSMKPTVGERTQDAFLDEFSKYI